MHRITESLSSFGSNSSSSAKARRNKDDVEPTASTSAVASGESTEQLHKAKRMSMLSADEMRETSTSNGQTRSSSSKLIDRAGPAGPSSTAGMHNLPSIAHLLTARKVYRASYVWRLDNHPAAAIKVPGKRGAAGLAASTSAAPTWVKYYMRLEDCLLCFWNDEALKKAQTSGGEVHPSSMNLTEAFVVPASRKAEWKARCADTESPTPHALVLNTAGANSICICTGDETDLRRWINAIRLSVWERQKLETLYTAARFGIREEQQRRPVRSALNISAYGSKMGRAEGLLDVRLPGDTEWRQVYAVLTDPGAYAANRNNTPEQEAPERATTSASTSKKDKRRSILSLFGGSSSKNSSSNISEDGRRVAGAMPGSPVQASYNAVLEDPQTGPTLALFGILSPTSASLPMSAGSPPNRRHSMDRSSSFAANQADRELHLTKRPIILISHAYEAHAVWPENEAFIETSKMFKVYGRINWLEQEITAYSQTTPALKPFEEIMRRDNRDAGRGGKEGHVLLMLAPTEGPPGPANAVRTAYREDTSGELLSWILAVWDAFWLHGRPRAMVYDQRSPISPYFCQPIGPARWLLYFSPELIEDLPGIEEDKPGQISYNFLSLLHKRMTGADLTPPARSARNSANSSPVLGSSAHNEDKNRQQHALKQSIAAYRDAPPILPAINTDLRPASKASRHSNRADADTQLKVVETNVTASVLETDGDDAVIDGLALATPLARPNDDDAFDRADTALNSASHSLSPTPVDIAPLRITRSTDGHQPNNVGSAPNFLANGVTLHLLDKGDFDTRPSSTNPSYRSAVSHPSGAKAHPDSVGRHSPHVDADDNLGGALNLTHSLSGDHYNSEPVKSATTSAHPKLKFDDLPAASQPTKPVMEQQHQQLPSTTSDDHVLGSDSGAFYAMSLADALPANDTVRVKHTIAAASPAAVNTTTAAPLTSQEDLPTPTAATSPRSPPIAKAFTGASTVASHSDYDVGLNYLAMTADTEHAEPVSTSRQGQRSQANGKPSITVNTAKPVLASSTASQQTYDDSRGAQSPSVASPNDPLSPDSYGLYAEKAAPVPAKTSNERRGDVKSQYKAASAPAPAPTMQDKRKPGRGVPITKKSGRRLGAWSSDEEHSDKSSGDDSDAEKKQEKDDDDDIIRPPPEYHGQITSQGLNPIDGSPRLSHGEVNHPGFRASVLGSPSSAMRRSLPLLPGPSSDPYINENAPLAPPGASPRGSYIDEKRSSQYDPRASTYSSSQNILYNMSPGWNGQYQGSPLSSPYAGSPAGHSPYGSQPANSPGYGGPGFDTMLDSIEQDPETAGADGKAMREAAVAPHGLLQAGIQQRQARSAREMEALAKETGASLLQLDHKAPVAQSGLVGAIATHEKDRKREGGLGAALTERDRERRLAEAKQREAEMMQARQANGNNMGQGMMPFGPQGFTGMGMPNMGFGNFNPMDPVQMQQQMAMLAAQNAYLQAMASFNNQGMQGGNMYGAPSAFGAPSQMGYAGSMMGMQGYGGSSQFMQGQYQQQMQANGQQQQARMPQHGQHHTRNFSDAKQGQ